jgi:hypothetical protein
MATGRSSPSLISYDLASSTAHDQASLASDIELVTLVPAVDNAFPEYSRRSSSIDSGAARSSLAAAVCPTRIETISLHGSIGCLIAIAFVVRIYDGEEIPKLASGLTINAIVSVLSNASRTGLIFVIGATMG